MNLWDTAGQEALSTLRKLAYPGANIFLFSFDMTNADSLENIKETWSAEVEENCDGSSIWGIILVGTKHDWWLEGDDDMPLVDEERVQQVKGSGSIAIAESQGCVFRSPTRLVLTK